MMENNEAGREKKSGSAALLRQIIAALVCFFGMVFLLAETYTLLTYLIPYLSVIMFRQTGISIAEGLTFAEFSVGDIVVMIMMWFFPALCGVLLLTLAQWKFICFSARHMAKLFAAAFRRNVS